ncbi:alanine racemase [Pollutimonas thiosulfatoxidans]|uniref:Alanine racemase n=1 Tax=Pollutimonas thiosulfatoxidans TaxID=2028345 RepID=A0A410GFY9_9BURK|nr:alanine racemase [Pollutimonas thiosulfatoxidans]QAA95200.1 alanine racemase [Pollutimonas thiosulfatoxidans]
MSCAAQSRIHARIDASAIAHNLARLRSLLALHSAIVPRVWAVCKADAYGHGLALSLPGMAAADGLAVMDVASAAACRELGWRKPILLLGSPANMAELQDSGLSPLHVVIDDESQLDELARQGPGDLTLWLRFSGDLRHAGFSAHAYRRGFERATRLQQTGIVQQVGHLLHYARAEEPEYLRAERASFEALVAGLPGPRCTENSAALLSDPEYAGSTAWVRSGIALYGISPLAGITGEHLGLKPAMTLFADIHAIQQVPAGSPLGYGGAFVAEHDLRIALVHCGYADGYPRQPGPDACVLIAGQECAVVGRVSMDTVAIDVTAHPAAQRGTTVTLWGDAALPVERIAASAGTIAAQLCTGLTARVPRLRAHGPLPEAQTQ